jgi:predicted nucleic acid-binding protein
MRPRGRPPATRGVHSLEDDLLIVPGEVLLDTSFVVDALIASQPLHDPCRDFLEQLAAADAIVYFNRLLEMELAETAFRLALKERFGSRNWLHARRDGRARRRAGRLMGQVRQAWDEMLDAFAYVRVELDEVSDFAPALMQGYGLSSYDAVHVATALYSDVDCIVTLDVGFASVPATLLTIHTSMGRVASCRRRRGARPTSG